MENEQFKGMEQARKEFNSWQGQARIYIDFENMEAWCMVHELPVYYSNSVIRLVGKDDLHGRNDKYGAERLNRIINAKWKAFKEGADKGCLEDDYAFAEYF